MNLFGKNGLANHAAAGAYGFLLSAAPALLIAAFFVSRAFQSSPKAAAELIAGIDSMVNVLDAEEIVESYLANSRPGITGLITLISILWATRIFALSLQRGLKIIFPCAGKSRPVRDFFVTLCIELVVIIAVFIAMLSSRMALSFYKSLGFLVQNRAFLNRLFDLLHRLLPMIILGLISCGAYRLVPDYAPRRKSAIIGSVFCVVLFSLVSYGFGILMNPSRYNLLYGALGSLIILLANVYFFFIFFFLGAQFCFVLDSFEALLFSRFRQINTEKQGNKKSMVMRLFGFPRGHLQKYIRTFEDGEIIFKKGDRGQNVFYVISGEAEIYLEDEDDGKSHKISVVREGGFFGEMEHLLSVERSATVKAKKKLTVMVLPPELFGEVLKTDPDTDRQIIETLSKRLKKTNDEFIRTRV
ncbi:YihY/virulence factor BrkB family protein [Treponema sp. OttesenSCG-928-L16]|nr:YihY/virulence factor BrkB family protein [Treponema sp. OttesenSCG-928-L16]